MEAVINVLIQALLGGAAGYITNEYAINMLFKSYTPLNIGGVIKKTRNEFIDNISRLVEDDLISADKIREILTDNAFVENFKNLSESFYNDCLYQITENISVRDIDGYEDTKDEILKFVNENLKSIIPELIDEIDKKLDITKIITDSQIEEAINKSYEQVVEIIQSENLSKELLSSYYDEYKYKNIPQILGDNLTNIITANTKALVNGVDTTLREEFDTEITEALSDIYDRLHIGQALGAFTEKLRQKKLSDILNSNAIGLKNKVSVLVNSYLETDACKGLVDEFSVQTLSYLKTIEISIYDLLNEETIKSLENIIKETAPYILNKVGSFTEYNKAEIENLIQDAVDEIVAAKNNPLLNMAKGSMLSNVAQKYNVISTIEGYLSGNSSREAVSNAMIDKMNFYLKSTTVGGLISLLENNNLLTNKAISQAVLEYLLQNSNNIMDNLYQRLTNISLENIDPDKSHIISDFLKDSIIRIAKESLIYGTGAELIKGKAIAAIDDIVAKDINELISTKQIEKLNLNNIILDTLNKNETKIKSTIHSTISDRLQNQQLKTIFGDNYKESLANQSVNYVNKTVKSTLNDMGMMTTHDSIDKLNTINNLSVSTEELIRKLIINNVDNILEGSIKAIVVSNLSKLSDDELCDMAHDFIGRQLQPIMIFGGILGVLAGTGLGIYNPNIDFLTPFSLNSTVTYGLVGYATNAIAINMLFRPYTEKKFLKKIPLFRHFALGYIVKNKNVLADSMTLLINDYLLNKDSVNELFDTYEDRIKQSFFETVSNDNYKLLTDVAKQNEYAISDFVFDYAYGKYYDYEPTIIQTITTTISDIKINSIINDNRRSLAHSYVKSFTTDYITNSEESIYTYLMSGKSLHNVLPEFITDAISDRLMATLGALVGKMPESINHENAREILSALEPKYKLLLDKKLKDIAPSSKLEDVMTVLNTLMLKSTESDKLSRSIAEAAANKLNELSSSDISLNDISNGILTGIINNKIDDFFEYASSNTVRLTSGYTAMVSQSIKAQVHAGLNFFTRIGYNSINGDGLIDEAVSKILVEKLPLFVEKNRTTLSTEFKDMVTFRMSTIKLNDLNISVNKEAVYTIASQFMTNEGTQYILLKSAGSLKDHITPQLAELKLVTILSPFGFNSINDIFESYEDELNALLDSVSSSAQSDIEIINSIVFGLAQQMYYHMLDDTRINDIFRGLKREELSKSIDHLLDLAFNTPAYDKFIGSVYADIQKHTNGKAIGEFIDKDELEHSVAMMLKKLSSDDDIIYTLRQSAGSIVNNGIQSDFSFIDTKTKDYLLNTIIDGCILSLRSNMDSILKDIHFDEIVRDQIKAMSPRKIHKMFNSFLGKYFRRLMFYGLGGAVFGINPAAGITLAAAYGIKRLVDNARQSKKLKTE